MPPRPTLTPRRLQPDTLSLCTAIQVKHGPLSTLARRVITLDWERAERRIRLFCYFSRSGLHSQSTPPPFSYSSHSVASLLSHTQGTLTFDLWWFITKYIMQNSSTIIETHKWVHQIPPHTHTHPFIASSNKRGEDAKNLLCKKHMWATFQFMHGTFTHIEIWSANLPPPSTSEVYNNIELIFLWV